MEHIVKLLRWFDVDRAIAYALLSKVWLLFAGPITLYLISLYLTPEMQGFYYTFLSLVALQVFIELGFYVVITQFASHEWAHLSFGELFTRPQKRTFFAYKCCVRSCNRPVGLDSRK